MTAPAPHLAQSLKLPGIAHGFFNRRGGVSTGIYASLNCGPGSDDSRARVIQNRDRVAKMLGTSGGHLLSLYQIHSAETVTVNAPWDLGKGPQADGMVTNVPGLALGILTADCGPVLFADSQAGVIGAAHAGWKGAKAGVLAATLKRMEMLGAKRANIHAALGPTISQANYEVGPEFKAAFEGDDPGNTRYFVPSEKPAHFMFDLPAFIASQLEGEGIAGFETLGLCTYPPENALFSYRRGTHLGEDGYGRNISAIMLEG